jgi:hypothetical protein
MKFTRSMFLMASLVASVFGTSSTIFADSSCNSCCTTNACNCCDCCLACCSDCNDCCDNSCGSCTTGTTNSCCDACGGCATSKDILLPFSEGSNRARQYAGVAHLQNLADQEDWNWHLDFALEYNQNFKRGLLGTYFFPNNTNRITVGEDRSISGSADVRGTDLGLSETFNGTLTICPKIQNVVFEPRLYVGLDRWVEGLWFDVSLPIQYTRWTMQACEVTTSSGGDIFNPGTSGGTAMTLFNTGTVAENSMKNNGTNGTTGADPIDNAAGRGSITPVGARSICQAFGGQATWGDKTSPLAAGRILCNCENNKTGVADIPLQLGYNFINRDRGYLGLYIRTVFPTGRINNQLSIFNPVIGYNRYQLGGGLQAKARLWERDDETSVNLFLDGYVTHVFSQSQCRIFDIKGRGAWSRYLLMKEADSNGNYTGRLVNFVDVFTACVKTQFPWQADVLAFLNVRHKGWTWDLGYEFQGRACEKFDCDCITLCSPCADGDTLKCDDDGDCCSATANTIGTKQYGVKGPQLIGQIGNLVRDAQDTTINTFGRQSTPVASNGIAASTTLINAQNFASYLDLETTRIPQAISNKIWSHLGYTWADRDYPIAAGLGFEVNFGAKNRQPRVWGLWGKLTVAYN